MSGYFLVFSRLTQAIKLWPTQSITAVNPQGISGKAIAFLVEFSDRSQGIYRADWRE